MKIEHIEKISEYLAIVESISADIRRSNSDELLFDQSAIKVRVSTINFKCYPLSIHY